MARCSAARTLYVAAALLAAAPAAGQAPEVSFAAGRVTITAQAAPLAAVLDAWERRGDARFVDAARLPEQSVTVQLVDVSELDALRVLLRSAGGYVAIPKAVPAPGTSAYDRVLIMAGRGSGAARSLPADRADSAAAGSAGGRPQRAEPAQAETSAAAELHELDDMDEVDDTDELDLVETLRRRYQSAVPEAAGDASSFRRQPDGAPPGTAPRPGVIVAAEEEPPDRPNPVRRRER